MPEAEKRWRQRDEDEEPVSDSYDRFRAESRQDDRQGNWIPSNANRYGQMRVKKMGKALYCVQLIRRNKCLTRAGGSNDAILF